ncbi:MULTISPECIES: type II toxin-antitoxin system VapC family toxin [unclassified Adlercreutzia]|uniref:type II toxin-antitoxin system VapC family toxin n=1 Tax=unclassified Adlercreutzia TaxID=2636013 RepID=UPI0013ED0F0D|nr:MULTISPECIES: type II toxin-antitoxin system VapC family toxin [unclassified Adlercreutzia]
MKGKTSHVETALSQGLIALSPSARKVILDAGNEIYVSDISVWEIAIKSVARPGSIPFTSREFAEACEESGLRLLPVSLAAIVAYEDLDCEAVGSAHRDPFDRLLIAQSKVSDMLFLTHDELLGLYGEPHVVVV